jgi:hypothetical protein
MIELAPLVAQNAEEWQEFLALSNNGVLFHSLDFLAYHPPGRFDFRHLMFRQEGKVVALLPGGVVEEQDGKRLFRSPCGASVGGFVVAPGQSTEEAISLVRQLQDYARSSGLHGIELRMGPSVYLREANEQMSFVLFANGFKLRTRWLSHVVPLSRDPEEVVERCKPGKIRDYRAGVRKGLNPREVDSSKIEDFYRLLLLTNARHNATATHSREEIEDLFRRVPGRLRLFLCAHEGQEIAGVLLFVLNPRAAYTFYICQDEAFRKLCPATVLLVHLARQLGAEGFPSLDLGPSSFDDLRLNEGLAAFKEGLGGRGYCRDAWRWELG